MKKNVDKTLTVSHNKPMTTRQILKEAARILGRKKSAKKAASSRKNGKLGGYWKNFK